MSMFSSVFPRPDGPCRSTRSQQAAAARVRAAAALTASALALVFICSCSPPPPPPPPPTPEPTPVRTPRPTPTPTPVPTPTPEPTPTPKPTPTPVVHHYAPEGTFFVMEDMTVRLKGGLMGVTAGSEVKMIKDTGESMQVTIGRDEFEVKKTQVTNDLDIAAAIAKRTQVSEAAVENIRVQQNAQYLKQQQAEMDYLRTHPLATATPTPSPFR